jgi:hypothetical protein
MASLVLALMVIAGTVAALTANDLGTHARLKSTRASLKVTSASLAVNQSDLASTRANLSTAQASLQLAQSQVSILKQELVSSQGALADATSLIGLLKTCLGGISQSATYGAEGRLGAAIAALSGAQTACNQASSELTTVLGA